MNRMKPLRLALSMKQSDLAQKLNVRQTTISNWETGKTEPDTDSLLKMASIFGVSVDEILGYKSSDMGSAKNRIPVLGDVAAGIPIEAIEDIVDYEEIDSVMASSGDYFGLRIKGASMEPRIREGDVVIVRKQSNAETGDTVVVLVNGDSATVKKIKKSETGITLIPNNPAYDPMYFSNEDIQSLPVRVIGKVVELRAKF